MKTIEEKAKAYDNVVGKLEQFMAQGVDPLITRADVQDFFPELKESTESEDEKVRKELLLDIPKVFPHDKAFRYIAWLEKQGEKGTNGNDRKIPNSEQESTDKVESKFHEGDWIITNKKHIWYVDETPETTSYLYRLINQYGKVEVAEFEVVDEKARLWTIQDAKEGDMLALNGEVFIYAHKKQLYPIAVAHCFVDSAGDFYFDGEFGYTEKGNSIRLATKEQRDKLEKAITKAGYEWNAKKKELRKIKEREKNGFHYDKGFQHGFSAAKFNQWKPTDEQMEAFGFYIKTDIDENGVFGQQLVKLYNDLKKLREE